MEGRRAMSETELPVDLETVAPERPRDEIEVVQEPPPIVEAPPGPALTRQPWAGIAGTVIVAGLVAVLAIAPGGPQTALQVSVPIATFALPVLVMMALWWSRWPTDRMSRPASLAI